jgi:hypothetical protein
MEAAPKNAAPTPVAMSAAGMFIKMVATCYGGDRQILNHFGCIDVNALS